MTTINKTAYEQEISFLRNLINDKDLNIQPKRDLDVVGLVTSFKPFLEKYKRNQRIQGNIDLCYKQLGRYKDIIYDLNKYEEYLLYSDVESIDLSLFFKYIYKLEDISEALHQTQQGGAEKSDIDVHDIIERAEQRLLSSILKYHLGMVKPFNPKVFIQKNQMFPSILDDPTCLDNIMQIVEFYSSQDKLGEVLRAYISERQLFLKGCLSHISISSIRDNEEMRLAIDSVSSFISLESYLIKDLNFASYLEEQHEDQGQTHGGPVLTSYAVFQQVVSAMCAKVLSKVKSEINSKDSDGLNMFVLANKITELTDTLVALDKENKTHTVIVEQFMNQQSTLNKRCLAKLCGVIADIPSATAMAKLPSDFGMGAKTVELFTQLKQDIDDYSGDVVRFMAHTEIKLKSWLPAGEKGAEVPTDTNMSSSRMKYQMFLLDFVAVAFTSLERQCLRVLATGKKTEYPQYFNSNYHEAAGDAGVASIPADEQTCIAGLFLSIHARALEQLLASNTLAVQRIHKLDRRFGDMCLVSWKKLIQPMMPLINNSSMKTTDANFKKNKETAKDKFNTFNTSLDVLLANWTLNMKPLIKDKALKKKLKKDIKMIVEPMYKLLYDKYSKGWFKNQEKYVRFDTRELSRRLDSL